MKNQKFAYSVRELSELTTLSPAYLRVQISNKRLKISKFGRRVLILRKDAERFLAQREDKNDKQ